MLAYLLIGLILYIFTWIVTQVSYTKIWGKGTFYVDKRNWLTFVATPITWGFTKQGERYYPDHEHYTPPALFVAPIRGTLQIFFAWPVAVLIEVVFLGAIGINLIRKKLRRS